MKKEIFIEQEFIDILNEGAGEGGLFFGGPSQGAQAIFMLTVLEAVKPKKVLEIGTHRANFCYLVKATFPEASIKTFGIDPNSASSVQKVNEKMKGKEIEFILGDSVKTVPLCDETFDLAWVDGAHDYATALTDLKNCADKNIPFILLDDLDMVSVHDALLSFLVEKTDYKMVLFSSDVRMTVLLSNQKIDQMKKWNNFLRPFLLALTDSQHSGS